MTIPEDFSNLIVARDGAIGREWLSGLSETIDALLERWACRADGPVVHGNVGIVVPVESPHGPAVIKVSPPHEGNMHEADGLRQMRGRGAVRLYEHAAEHTAMLLERADGPRPEDRLTVDESIEMMGDLARGLAVVADEETFRLADTADGWERQLDEQLHRAPGVVSAAAVHRARAAIDMVRADRTWTLLHGDLHEANVLGASREPWLAIDVKGWAGTAAHDAWTVALTRPASLLASPRPDVLIRERIRRFAQAAGVDPAMAREVSHARAVSSLLYELTTGGDASVTGLLGGIVNEGL